MPSVCLSCICFTLEGRQPEENQQTSMFLLWLSQIAARGGLQREDKIMLFTDKPTFEQLEEETVFSLLRAKLSCEFQSIILPQPKTCLEGCLWKQKMIPQTQDIFFQCDIDVLCLRGIHPWIDSLAENTFAVQIEGPLSDPNQGAALSDKQKETMPSDAVGFSAGKFVIHGKDAHFQLIQRIQEIAAEHTSAPHQTLEQPYFNRAVLDCASEFQIILDVTPFFGCITNQIDEITEKTVFFDLMGEPGNGKLHLSKMIEMIAYFTATNQTIPS